MNPPTPYYGLLAEFETPQAVLKATRTARREGYRVMDAYTPYPVEGPVGGAGPAADTGAVRGPGRRRRRGRSSGFFMQTGRWRVDYPFNVGGRPLQQLAGVHPDRLRGDDPDRVAVGAVRHAVSQRPAAAAPPGLQRAALFRGQPGRFFLCIEALDPRFDPVATREFLAGQGAKEVLEVPHEAP